MTVSGSTEIRQLLEHAEEGILYSVCQSTRSVAGIRYAMCEGKGRVFVIDVIWCLTLSYLIPRRQSPSLSQPPCCLIGSPWSW